MASCQASVGISRAGDLTAFCFPPWKVHTDQATSLVYAVQTSIILGKQIVAGAYSYHSSPLYCGSESEPQKPPNSLTCVWLKMCIVNNRSWVSLSSDIGCWNSKLLVFQAHSSMHHWNQLCLLTKSDTSCYQYVSLLPGHPKHFFLWQKGQFSLYSLVLSNSQLVIASNCWMFIVYQILFCVIVMKYLISSSQQLNEKANSLPSPGGEVHWDQKSLT